jgi:hypothetical protein
MLFFCIFILLQASALYVWFASRYAGKLISVFQALRLRVFVTGNLTSVGRMSVLYDATDNTTLYLPISIFVV